MGEPTCTGAVVVEVTAIEECGCPTDLNNGGLVDVTDLLLFTDYGCMSGCTADFNGDDIVNVNDLDLLDVVRRFLQLTDVPLR